MNESKFELWKSQLPQNDLHDLWRCNNHAINWIITTLDMGKAELTWVADCHQYLMNEAKFKL